MNEGKYNIKAICNMLGIQPGTLRAWERRYKFIQPVRNEVGHRLYTDNHVRILKWLIEKVQNGFTIGQAVSLLEANQVTDTQEEINKSTYLADQITTALLAFDEYKATEYLNEAFSLFSIDKVTMEILANVLITVGEKWENGEISTAHEHFATSFLRTRFGMIFQNLPINPILPKVVAVCGPGEQHELGLFIFTIYLRRRGFQVIYLGASIAEDDIELVIDEVEPKLFIMSCALSEHVDGTVSIAKKIEKKFPNLIVGIGGAAFYLEENAEKIEGRFVGNEKKDWEVWLGQKLS